MASNASKNQSNAKMNISLKSLGGGSKKNNKKGKKQVKKTVKSIGVKGVLIVLLFLLIGAGVGAGATYFICKNDCFELIGSDELSYTIGEDGVYFDQGCKVISFGKDISSSVTIETNLTKLENGGYTASEAGTYYIIYKVTDDIKYGKVFSVQKIRLVTFELDKDPDAEAE